MERLSVVSGQLSVDDDQTLADSGFYWREKDGVKVLVCRALEDAGFVNGFSTRIGGVSQMSEPPASAGGQISSDLNLAGFDEDDHANIYENRRRFLAIFDGDFKLATAWQVHGDTIKTIATFADADRSEERADALISDLNKVLVGVKTADCVPILIGDPTTRAFAAVHAGWRGTVQSIAAKTVDELARAYRSKPADLICAIGPAASGRNYEVGQDVIDAYRDNLGDASDEYFTPTCEGHALVDLHAANRDQLIAAGVDGKNIFTAPLCTMERPDLFFSYRLEKRTFGKTGRLLSVIGRAL
jgi:YfiH family protein